MSTLQLSDAPKIAYALKLGSVAFSYVLENMTEFLIFIVPSWIEMNSTHKYGSTAGHYWVGVVYKGAFHFKFDLSKPLHEDYVAEKLGLTPRDAIEIAELFNKIAENL